MAKQPLNIGEEVAVQMPMKTVASLICMVAIGTWAYFGIIETQNKIQTTVELMSKDLISSDKQTVLPEGFEPVGSLPPTPMPDAKMVANASQINQQGGLTQTEAALLSPSEQVIARRT